MNSMSLSNDGAEIALIGEMSLSRRDAIVRLVTLAVGTSFLGHRSFGREPAKDTRFSMKVMRIVGLVLLWLVTALASLTFAKAGYGKFADAAGWQYWFQRWGLVPWFATVIGVVELGGGILLLVPRLAPYAAALLIAVMLGAFYTVSTNETDLSQVDPVMDMVLAGIALSARWRHSAKSQWESPILAIGLLRCIRIHLSNSRLQLAKGHYFTGE